MVTDLAIIHALECSLDAKKDAIIRLKNVAKVERKYKKGWDANDA